MKFNVGDKIKIVKPFIRMGRNHVGSVGKIVEFRYYGRHYIGSDPTHYVVKFDCYKRCHIFMRYELEDSCEPIEDGEQKPTDKAEPKFEIEEGKWYVCTQTYTLRGKIVVIKGQTYKSNQDGAIEGENTHLFIDKIDGKALNYFKPWTIQDAKDGDVLCSGQIILLFEKWECNDWNFVIAYAGIDISGKLQITDGHWLISNYAHPATKEQRDLLFQKMKEAGYEWDANKKELKKIEQKPAKWSEEDEKKFSDILAILRGGENCYYNSPILIDWLKSLKERVQPQPKQEWSEKDKAVLDALIRRLEGDGVYVSPHLAVECLKSIRSQSQWKPSEKQIEALEHSLGDYNIKIFEDRYEILKSLYNELKKLKE